MCITWTFKSKKLPLSYQNQQKQVCQKTWLGFLVFSKGDFAFLLLGMPASFNNVYLFANFRMIHLWPLQCQEGLSDFWLTMQERLWKFVKKMESSLQDFVIFLCKWYLPSIFTSMKWFGLGLLFFFQSHRIWYNVCYIAWCTRLVGLIFWSTAWKCKFFLKIWNSVFFLGW